MKFLILLLSAVLIMSVRCVIEEDNGVLVVTHNNWDEVVNDDTMAMIEFCKYIALQYYHYGQKTFKTNLLKDG